MHKAFLPSYTSNLDQRKEESMNIFDYILVIYLIAVNITAFVMMGVDKRRAIRHEWRIPEARLFASALLGGGAGAVIGMYTFRHKTKHWYFVVGMPLIMILNFAIIYLVVRYTGIF